MDEIDEGINNAGEISENQTEEGAIQSILTEVAENLSTIPLINSYPTNK